MPTVYGVNGSEPRYLDKPKHPIREVLTWLCGKQPPYYVQGYDYRRGRGRALVGK